MRIGIFTDSYVPQANGVAISVNMLYQGLTKLGHEVYVITTEHRIPHEFDPHIIRLKGFDVPLQSFDGFQLVPAANQYYSLIKAMNLDVLHIHTEFSIGRFGIRCGRKFHIPYVYTMHTMYEDYMHHVIKYGRFALKKPFVLYVETMIRWFCRDAKSIILPHEKVRAMFTRYHLNKHIQIVPTGLDLDHFDCQKYSKEDVLKLKESLGLKDEFVMLYIGRLAEEKAIDIMIKQYATFKDDVHAKMVIVGDGPIMDKLTKLTDELGLNNHVIFTGLVDWSQIGLYYQLGDCFINASITETQGLTYIEALMSNLPVVVRHDTNLDGLVKDGENGLFYYKDEEFPIKMKEVINNKELLLKLKSNAHASVVKLSKENYSKTIEKIYLDAINDNVGK